MVTNTQELSRLVDAWNNRRREHQRRRILPDLPRIPSRRTGQPTMNRNLNRRELLETRERRIVMSAAHTFGRLHASFYYLINTSANENTVASLRATQRATRDLSSAQVNLENLAEMEEGYIQFAQAREDGLIRRHRESGAWVSTIPGMHDLVDLSSRVSWFADEFQEAVDAQHSDHYRALLNECLLTIATELTFWGLGRAVRLIRVSESAGRTSRGLVSLYQAATARLSGTRSRLIRAATQMAHRLTRGRVGVPISLCPRTGRTLRGVGPPHNIGRAQTLPQDIGRTRTLPQDLGRAQTLPARGQASRVQPASGPMSAIPQSQPSTQGRIQGSGGIEVEALTADDAMILNDFLEAGGSMPTASVSQTWGSSRVMLESYTAKWTQFGMTGVPPAHGFRVYEGGVLRSVIVHLAENPLLCL